METPLDEGRKLYGERHKELAARQLSNAENFDRSILSLSSALLALSIAFIRPTAGQPSLYWIPLLYWSWMAFAISMVLTLASFLASQKAINDNFEFARRYYLQGDESAFNKPSWWATMNTWLTLWAGIALVVGLALTVAFAFGHIPGGEPMPTNRSGDTPISAQRPSNQIIERGAPISPMIPMTPTQSPVVVVPTAMQATQSTPLSLPSTAAPANE